MILPTIHLNGNSADQLIAQYAAAHKAVEDAVEALAACDGHNGRNIYPQGQPAMLQAVSEHVDRLDALRKMSSELLELMIHCHENGSKR